VAATDRAQLREYIQCLAIIHGPTILSSGRMGAYYFDLRLITLHGRAAPLVGRVMLDLVDDWTFAAAGGPTMGADPVAAAMLHAAVARRRTLDTFVVRKVAKPHGLQKAVEGPDVAGRRVLVVEDTSTTGGSVLQAVETLRQSGARVIGVAVIVDRNTGARETVEAAGLPYRAAFDLHEFGLS